MWNFRKVFKLISALHLLSNSEPLAKTLQILEKKEKEKDGCLFSWFISSNRRKERMIARQHRASNIYWLLWWKHHRAVPPLRLHAVWDAQLHLLISRKTLCWDQTNVLCPFQDGVQETSRGQDSRRHDWVTDWSVQSEFSFSIGCCF